TAEGTRTWTDFAGRVWKVDMAHGGVNRSHYNAVGQLIKQVDADSVTTLYAYDSEGQVTVTALDMNRDDSIGYSGTDRITRTTRSVTTRAGTTVQRSLTEVWATDNSAASSTLSITDQSVDGLQRWQEQGNLTTQQYDQPVGGSWAGSWTSTTLYPDNSSSVQTYTLGRMTSSVRRDALNALVESSTNVPDAHGRVSTQTDGRGAVTTLIYETQPNPVSGGYSISADLLYQLKSPPQTLSGTIPVTTYLYDAMGRRTTTTDALAGTTIQTYTKRGEVETISGTRQYPLSYTYTAQGRMKTMITSSGMTTWNYHSDSGLLANKIYGAQTAYSLTYTPAARPLTKTITYDEASRIKNVSLPSGYSMAFLSPSGSYSAQYGYHPQSNVISTIAMKNNNNPLLDVVYDRLLNGAIKDVAYTAAGGNTSLARSLYGFDDLSRRKQLTREDASTWDWGYNARSEVETAARKFPDNAAVPLESFGYTFDAIGNPLTRTQGTRSRTFTPNALNQIATRTQPSFLPITGSASSTANVIVNSTATQRKQGYFWAEVPVNNSASALYEKVNVTSSLPGAGVGGADLITKITGSLYVPPANQTPMYDADGNLTQDSRWDYAWDAENRLVSMTERVNSAAPSPNNPPRTKLEFVYDPLSRRVGKRVYRWPSGSTAWVLDRTVRFFWDGWHLVYEKHTPAFSGIVRDFHYIWGNDLSGERGGAGSVGGLLFAISAGSYTQTNPGRVRQIFDYNYIPAQDANGNVTSLLAINSDLSIKIDASYHYDAFGQESANTLRSNDVNGREFPFRFSGKYHDAETGLAYYGYRYYNPELGRWISRDPIEESGGVNLYGFCYNDPVNNYDNDGRQVFGLRMSPILEPFVRPGPIVEPMVRPTSPLASNPYPNLPLPVAPPTPQPLPELSPQPRKAQTSQLPEQPKGQNSPEYLYRSMMATSGLPGLIFGGPQLGESARKLGVRIEGNQNGVALVKTLFGISFHNK
ncbi:MAG: hypothetical protein NTV80_04340, partial [Verrucomicrobia bacterium]|nr:hypothetical protein [Verrucomicrobiota bacterium]